MKTGKYVLKANVRDSIKVNATNSSNEYFFYILISIYAKALAQPYGDVIALSDWWVSAFVTDAIHDS